MGPLYPVTAKADVAKGQECEKKGALCHLGMIFDACQQRIGPSAGNDPVATHA